jgi:hypothetical protein
MFSVAEGKSSLPNLMSTERRRLRGNTVRTWNKTCALITGLMGVWDRDILLVEPTLDRLRELKFIALQLELRGLFTVGSATNLAREPVLLGVSVPLIAQACYIARSWRSILLRKAMRPFVTAVFRYSSQMLEFVDNSWFDCRQARRLEKSNAIRVRVLFSENLNHQLELCPRPH